jgi:hypothetical protein
VKEVAAAFERSMEGKEAGDEVGIGDDVAREIGDGLDAEVRSR